MTTGHSAGRDSRKTPSVFNLPDLLRHLVESAEGSKPAKRIQFSLHVLAGSPATVVEDVDLVSALVLDALALSLELAVSDGSISTTLSASHGVPEMARLSFAFGIYPKDVVDSASPPWNRLKVAVLSMLGTMTVDQTDTEAMIDVYMPLEVRSRVNRDPEVAHHVDTASISPLDLDLVVVPFRGRRAKSRRLNILYADDKQSHRIMMESLLRSAGHAVTVVNEGSAAIEALEDCPYDVVLLDLRMPGTSGMEVMRFIRTLEGAGPYTPFIVITGAQVIDLHLREECHALGAVAVLAKPVQRQRLLDEIAAADKANRSARLEARRAAFTEVSVIDRLMLESEVPVIRGSLPRHIQEALQDAARCIHGVLEAAGRHDWASVRLRLTSLRGAGYGFGCRVLIDRARQMHGLNDQALQAQTESLIAGMTATLEQAHRELASIFANAPMD